MNMLLTAAPTILFFSIIFQKQHILMILMLLELILMSTFFNMMLNINILAMNPLTPIAFLTFTAAMAAVGMAVMIKIIRTNGTQFMSSMSINKC